MNKDNFLKKKFKQIQLLILLALTLLIGAGIEQMAEVRTIASTSSPTATPSPTPTPFWVSTGSSLYYDAGNVGIGNSNPSAKLQVSGTTVSGISPGTPADYPGRSLVVTTRPLNDGIADIGFDPNSTYRGAFDFTGRTGDMQWWTNNGSGWVNPFTIAGNGNIGIGNSNPLAKLQVSGTVVSGISPGTPADYSGRSLVVTTRPLNDGIADIGFDPNSIYKGALDFIGGSGNLQWWTNNGSGWVSPFTIMGNGNVGIGNSNPSAKLQVSGTVVSGISPGTPADYPGRSLVVTTRPLNDGIADIGFDPNSIYRGAFDFTGRTGDMQWWTNNGSGWINPFTIAGNGNVGMTGTLTVAGGITGATFQATYQDVAEWVPSTQQLSAGTVVVLDEGKTNHVIASTKSYDTKVAGVISQTPGLILGESGTGKLKVATTGRVKVKVDATKAPIKVGDLLVTGDLEGAAMKSVPVNLGGTQIHRPGTIIGKALEPLAGGVGEILVLLSLQ